MADGGAQQNCKVEQLSFLPLPTLFGWVSSLIQSTNAGGGVQLFLLGLSARVSEFVELVVVV